MIGLAILSLVFVALAADEWSGRPLWVGLGFFLAGMTLVRPWWFWENYKARGPRGLLGDGPTAGIYLAVAAVMIWVGLFTDWTFGRR